MARSSLLLIRTVSILGLLSSSVEAFVAARRPTTSISATATTAETANDDDSLPLFPSVQVTDPSNPLIQAANKFIYTQSGFYSAHDASKLSDEFVFRGPYIGPLNKVDYLSTMDTFGIYKAIPDINPNAFGFSIDPQDSNRVWFMVRNTGTFSGQPLGLGKDGPYIPPNNAKIQGCPETFSITFDNDHQKVKYLSVGYVADRFEGNTNGKGAAVGIFNAIGVPFPSPGPVLQLFQWFGTEVVNSGASSYSTENIPEWWTQKSQKKASEGYL